ncbi:hypothetical protein DL98DRAFT_570192 [Cadophora sp. DSE1049]|nr:hypothetical protein DL98DRAFT_570192 [Cadophora sp. DSE1049]
MSVGFGFSVGDFIAAIDLIGKVIDALRSSSEAGSEYRELLVQLFSLETALLQVKRLDCDDTQYQEVIALRQAAAQCKRTIDSFWEKNKRYQPSLEGRGSTSTLRNGWMKIRWAVCKKDDITKFKRDLAGHTEAIQLLLATVQMSQAKIHDRRQDTQQKSLMAKVQEGYFNCMQRLVVAVDQGKQLHEMTTSVMQTVIKTFQIVLQIQGMITAIPGQVDRQQPVYMIDALGKTSHFNLEFVRSAEALVAVLKINFRKHSNAEDKIARGDFAIHDSATKQDVDLSRDWDLCFSPGQRVIMSIILDQSLESDTLCPKCRAANRQGGATGNDIDIECFVCGLSYRRVLEVLEIESDPPPDEVCVDTSDSITTGKDPPVFGPEVPSKQERKHDELADFRHVRIRDKALSPVSDHQTGVQHSDHAPHIPSIEDDSSDETGKTPPGELRIDRKRRKLNLLKCKPCRDARKKCLPENRVWPEKCNRCLKHRPGELECSEPAMNTRTRGRNVAREPERRRAMSVGSSDQSQSRAQSRDRWNESGSE